MAIEKEVIAIVGDTLKIEKNDGSTWSYRVRGEVNRTVLDLLKKRQSEGHKLLAIATLEETPNPKVLRLVSLGI